LREAIAPLESEISKPQEPNHLELEQDNDITALQEANLSLKATMKLLESQLRELNVESGAVKQGNSVLNQEIFALKQHISRWNNVAKSLDINLDDLSNFKDAAASTEENGVDEKASLGTASSEKEQEAYRIAQVKVNIHRFVHWTRKLEFVPEMNAKNQFELASMDKIPVLMELDPRVAVVDAAATQDKISKFFQESDVIVILASKIAKVLKDSQDLEFFKETFTRIAKANGDTGGHSNEGFYHHCEELLKCYPDLQKLRVRLYLEEVAQKTTNSPLEEYSWDMVLKKVTELIDNDQKQKEQMMALNARMKKLEDELKEKKKEKSAVGLDDDRTMAIQQVSPISSTVVG
jgi:hypothetical protein